MATCAPSRIAPLGNPHEGSALRPARDRDDVRQGWKHVAKNKDQVSSDRQAIEQLTRKVEAIRRRMLGGGGGTISETPVSTGVINRGEWSAGLAYEVDQFVTRGALGQFWCVQPVAGADIGFEPERGAPFWQGMTSPPPGIWA